MNGVVAAWRRFNNDPVEFAGLADRGPQQKKRKRYKEREGRGRECWRQAAFIRVQGLFGTVQKLKGKGERERGNSYINAFKNKIKIRNMQ